MLNLNQLSGSSTLVKTDTTKRTGSSCMQSCTCCWMSWPVLLFRLSVSPRSSVLVRSHQRAEEITRWCHHVSDLSLWIHCAVLFLLFNVSYLMAVFSLDRWWVRSYHVWSTGNTGVFCRAAQVSQCGSLSEGVSDFSLQEPYFRNHRIFVCIYNRTAQVAAQQNHRERSCWVLAKGCSQFNIC